MEGSTFSNYQELDNDPSKGEAKYNKKLLWLLVINSSLSGFLLGYQYGSFNISQEAVVSWLGWGDDSLLLVTIGTTLVPIGAIFGALTGGASDRLGRRKYLMINDIVAFWGCAINWIPTTPTFMIGRFVGGWTCGAAAACSPLYNTEYSPNKMRGSLGNCFQVQVNTGVLTAYVVALPVLWLDTYWLYIVFAFPVIPAGLQILIFMYHYKYEPAPWSLKKEKFDDARAAIDLVYYPKYADKKYQRELQKSKEQGETGAGIKELLCNRKYSKEMFVGNLVAAFQNLSGANLIIFYSTAMFTQGGNSSIGPYLTVAVGAVLWISGFPSIPLMQKDRRPSFIIGYAALGSISFLIALLAIFNLSLYARIILVMLWIIAFSLTVCPMTWTYLSEILSDSAMSISTTTNMVSWVIVVASSDYMINYLGLPLTFFIYGGINVLAFLFSIKYVVETNNKGKADVRMASFSYN